MMQPEQKQPKNMKPIGNGQFEAICCECDAVFILEKADDTFIKLDEEGNVWPVCSKCHPGPRADPKTVSAVRAKILGENKDS